MKGKIVKSNHKTVEPFGSQVGSTVEWEVEYEEIQPHAGVSKMGTGPGSINKITENKRIPLHPSFYEIAEEGKEVEFEIDPMTPVSLVNGQEQYSGTIQVGYGRGARILNTELTFVNKLIGAFKNRRV